MAAEPMSFTGNAGHVAVDRWNQHGQRGPLVMLHGGGQTRHSWRRAAPTMAADGWHVFTVDSRGHGESSLGA